MNRVSNSKKLKLNKMTISNCDPISPEDLNKFFGGSKTETELPTQIPIFC